MRLVMDVTNRCNMSCVYCGVRHESSEKTVMPAEMYRKIAERMFAGVSEVTISCGYEALTVPYAREMVELLRLAPAAVLLTNGMLLDREISGLIVSAGLKRLIVSVDSADPAGFAALRKGGDLETIISNLETLRSIKEEKGTSAPEVVFAVTPLRSNMDGLCAVAELAGRTGARAILVKPLCVLPECEADMKEERLLPGDGPAVRAALEQTIACARKKGVKVELSPELMKLTGRGLDIKAGGAFRCGESAPLILISADGMVRPCTRWPGVPAGDLLKMSVGEIIEGPAFSALNAAFSAGGAPEVCAGCDYLLGPS